ncbi:hypothetical protein [Moellerella wisconsensis]|uniref:hypothetical protein n=1 Tax=Moellerella wisconsensis TaxID=158849 RepID=UPI003AABB6FB
MRIHLSKFDGERLRFVGVVTRHGSKKKGYKDLTLPTLLLSPVETLSGEFVADHLWMNVTKHLQDARVGDTVEFDARVGMYEKGYKGKKNGINKPISKDYRLERPTKIVLHKKNITD